MKVLPENKVPLAKGWVLHDCHAEGMVPACAHCCFPLMVTVAVMADGNGWGVQCSHRDPGV